jgi:hypothetical protein
VIVIVGPDNRPLRADKKLHVERQRGA